MRLLVTAVITLIFSVSAAQPPGPGAGMGPGGEPGHMRGRIKEKIETIKIWRLTESVGLTPEQSEKFFPIYNRFQNQVEKLEDEQRNQLRHIDELVGNSNSTDSDIRAAMDNYRDLDLRKAEARDTFLRDISKVLSVRQQGKLLAFEERFKRELQDLIWRIRRELRGGPGRDKR